jgi:hypothetical protein
VSQGFQGVDDGRLNVDYIMPRVRVGPGV